MRIAFLGDALDLQYAGIHIYTREIIRAISELDKKNEYFVIRAKQQYDFPNAKEIVVPIRSYIPMHQRIRQFREIPSALKAIGVDIAIEPCHFGPFNLPPEVKRITIIHDLTPILFPEMHNFTSQLMHRKLLPKVLKQADKIITNSNHTSEDVIKAFPFVKQKIKSIPLGKESIFVPAPSEAVLAKHGIEAPYFLFVGTIEPRKNIDVLLEAYEQFRKNNQKKYQLVIVGKRGWNVEELMEDIARSVYWEDIIIVGYVDREELPAIYSSATIFIYPSLYEGFGLPVLEAMACGVPVLISKASSLPEVGGKAAHYFDPESVSELLDQMLWLCENEAQRKRSAQKSLKQAAKFSWETAAAEMIKVFEAL